MTTEANRVPAGIRTGGQFTATVHGEAPVRLFNRNDGSFFKPSPSSTAEHCIEFWSSVPIPDEIIDQAEKTYAKVRDAEVAADMNTASATWTERYLSENPQPKRDKDLAAWTATYDAELKEYQDSIRPGIESSRPLRLGNYDSRQIVRAAQMYFHQPDYVKFREESDKLMNHQVELFDTIMTVGEIERTYQMSSIHYCLEEIHKDDSLQQKLLATMEEVNGGIHGVHTALTYQTNLQQQQQEY